jgi:hypothetical protein
MAGPEDAETFREHFEGQANEILTREAGAPGLTVAHLGAGAVVAAAEGNLEQTGGKGAVVTLSHSPEAGFVLGAVMLGLRAFPMVNVWKQGQLADSGESGFVGYVATYTDRDPAPDAFAPDTWVGGEGALAGIYQDIILNRLADLWLAPAHDDALLRSGRLDDVRKLLAVGDWPFHYDSLFVRALRGAA